MPEYPASWGPEGGFDSNDYSLAMLDRSDGTFQDLIGHSLTSPNVNARDALKTVEVERVGGRPTIVTITKRAAEITDQTYTVGYPKKALHTPLMQIARDGRGCPVDLLRVYECPPDPQYAHFYGMFDSVINPPQQAADTITNTEDRAILEQTSEVTFTKEEIGWGLTGSIVHTVASKKINGVTFLTDDCAGCDFTPGLDAIIVGGDGTAVPTVQMTDNRFASITAKSMGALLDLGKHVYNVGDTIVTALAIGATYAAATVGKLTVSQDRLATAAVTTSVVDVISRIVGNGGNTIFAVGKDSAGAGVLHVSLNRGNSWTAVVSANLPAGAVLGAAWDRFGQRLWMVGEGGYVGVGVLSSGTMQITDLTTIFDEAASDMAAVVVLAKNHIFVGGETGIAKETRDGGATWADVIVAGTTTITAAAGNKGRLVVGAGTNVYIRDPLSKMAFKKFTFAYGVTLAGVVADIAMAPDNFNLFAVTTLSGEVAILRPYYPGA